MHIMPTIDVIIPMGPGHESLAQRAGYSVKVAWNYDRGPFGRMRVLVINDLEGQSGRSDARNSGVSASRADWLFFLDADDLMHNDAFKNVSMEMLENYHGIFGLTTELGEDGNISTRYQVPRIESYQELIQHNPWYTITMGHFVRRATAKRLPFSSELNTGEDWDYYLRLWKAHECIKIEKPLFIRQTGHHSTGPRSATGRQWSEVTGVMLEQARAESPSLIERVT